MGKIQGAVINLYDIWGFLVEATKGDDAALGYLYDHDYEASLEVLAHALALTMVKEIEYISKWKVIQRFLSEDQQQEIDAFCGLTPYTLKDQQMKERPLSKRVMKSIERAAVAMFNAVMAAERKYIKAPNSRIVTFVSCEDSKCGSIHSLSEVWSSPGLSGDHWDRFLNRLNRNAHLVKQRWGTGS